MMPHAEHPGRVAIIGANGQLGCELRLVLGGDVSAFDQPEFDVRDEKRVRAALEACRPKAVINCAAMTNVDGCEGEPEAAFSVNAIGALHVARAASEVGARLIYVSTDYVFGGEPQRRVPHQEGDAASPVNVYGASKLAGEHLSLAYSENTLVVRTASLYGSSGVDGKASNFVETMLGLAEKGGQVRVVDDQVMSPTSARVCADRIALLLATGMTGVCHVAPPDACSWYQFAREIFRICGLTVDVVPVSSAAFPRPARRPAYSVLATNRLRDSGVPVCPGWREMLEAYLRPRSVVFPNAAGAARS